MPAPPIPANNPKQCIGDYAVGETIGRGSFGKVKRGVHVPTGAPVAIKILNRQKLKRANMDKKIKREINILKLFRHPNIGRLYDVVPMAEDIFLIMEFVEGGELYDHIVDQGKLTEDSARYVFQQIVCALEYCHHFRVVHRDLKPENILLGPNLQVKLIDFGLSNLMHDGDFLATSCGSPNYAAPEVISGKLYCGPEVDVWSCGVILYALLCGCLPFDEEQIPILFQKIKKGKYDVPPHVTPPARELLAQLLTVDPLHRATIPQIRDNAWFREKLPAQFAFHARIYEEHDRCEPQIAAQVAEKLGITVERVRRAVEGRETGTVGVSYSILLDIDRRDSLVRLGERVQSGGDLSGIDAATATGAAAAASRGGSAAAASTAAAAAVADSATRGELNLGLPLSINPAIELLLDSGDATSNKEIYNNCDYVPISNRSLAPSASSLQGASAGLGGGFSFSRQRDGLLEGGGSVGSRLGPGSLTAARAAGSLSRPSAANFVAGSTSNSNQLRVGSVAKTTLAYSVEETEMALRNSGGWRVGLMTSRRSAEVMTELFDILRNLDMCWKVLSPFRLAAKFNDPPQTAAGKAREAARNRHSTANAGALAYSFSRNPLSGQNTSFASPRDGAPILPPHRASGGDAAHSSSNFSAGGGGGAASSFGASSSNAAIVAAAAAAAAASLADSFEGPLAGGKGAGSAAPLVLVLSLFRLQEKHDKGYIVDFAVRNGVQPLATMDLIVDVFEELLSRLGEK